jgi:hypothetical protein
VLKPLAFHALKPLSQPKYLFSKLSNLRSALFVTASLIQFDVRSVAIVVNACHVRTDVDP